MKFIGLFALTIFASQSFAEIQIQTIADVAVMQKNANGTYDVVCSNGNRETITDLDLKLNNLCPNLKSSTPSNILSLQNRGDGTFDVVCKDLTKTVATTDEILAGKVCAPVAGKVDIEEGNYTSADGWAPCRIETTIANGVLTQIKLDFNYGFILAPCAGSVCKGDWSTSSSYKYTATIIDSKSFELSDDTSNSGSTIYRKQ